MQDKLFLTDELFHSTVWNLRTNFWTKCGSIDLCAYELTLNSLYALPLIIRFVVIVSLLDQLNDASNLGFLSLDVLYIPFTNYILEADFLGRQEGLQYEPSTKAFVEKIEHNHPASCDFS